MATQRAGKSHSGEDKNGVVAAGGMNEAARARQAKKAKILKEQQRNAKIRWMLVAVLLILAAIGFCYYYWYYLPSNLPRRTAKVKGETPKNEKQKPVGKKGKESQQQQKKPVDKKNARNEEELSRRQEELEKLENLKKRVLRQPLTPDDPDRPHALNIIAADKFLVEGEYSEALDRFNAIISQFPQSPRALLGKGLTLVRMARQKKSNKLMDTAIEFFRKAGLDSFLATKDVKLSALLAMVEHARERGDLKLAIQGAEKLVELYEDKSTYANQLGMLYLSQGNIKKAKAQFKKNVQKFEDDHFAKAQLGHILYSEKQYEQALPLMLDGIRHNEEVRMNGNFYNHAGDALNRLNRSEEALALYSEAVGLDLFPSLLQRSVLNEPGLTASPWWSVKDTGYMPDIVRIEKGMQNITREALALFDPDKRVFVDGTGKETLHYLLFSKGKKNMKNCLQVRQTCALLETFPEAVGCKRGTIKFSTISPQVHVPPHVGSTNVKLQVLVVLEMDSEGELGVRVGEDTKLIENHQIGIIDESFEKEVWYVGRTPALYLTVDVWHPDLSRERQKQLAML